MANNNSVKKKVLILVGTPALSLIMAVPVIALTGYVFNSGSIDLPLGDLGSSGNSINILNFSFGFFLALYFSFNFLYFLFNSKVTKFFVGFLVFELLVSLTFGAQFYFPFIYALAGALIGLGINKYKSSLN